MSLKGVVLVVSIIAALFSIGAYYAFSGTGEVPTIKDGWWGKGEKKHEDESVKKITITVDDDVLADLKQRLSKTRFFETLEGVQWEYGSNQKYMKELVKFWIEKFDWKAQEKLINSFANFETRIEGIKVHYLHVKPQLKQGQKLIPIMFIHGWPGSFFEFYKVIPLLMKESGDFAYEIICPSIPGYGFSEAPHRQGFSALSAAGILVKLMARLKHYYVQGGDWGAGVARFMAYNDKRAFHKSNERHKPLEFTIEFEEDHVLPFVGMQLINKSNKIETNVYVKPTNTGLLLHYDSHVDARYKHCLLNTMLDRAWRLSSSQESFASECSRLEEVFVKLHYPENLIRRTIKSFVFKKISPTSLVQEPTAPDKVARFALPFKDQPSADSVKCHLKDLGRKIGIDLQPVFVSKKLGKELKYREEKPPIVNQQRVVYEFKCGFCDESYVGYTL